MSQNFLKVKRKLIADMENTPFHTQKSWCDIMLKAANRCTSDEDQKEFFRFILNPNDSWDVQEPTFMEVTPGKDIILNSTDTITVVEEEDEKQSTETLTVKNSIHTNGNTTYITVTPT